jgi:hypothetical protein
MISSEAWVINHYTPPQSIPSPAATNSSDERSKRSCTESSWTSLISLDEESTPEFSNSDDQPQPLDMSDCTSFSLPNEFLFRHNGLPTPALSPPQVQFLSPMVLESRPESRSTSVAAEMTSLCPPGRPASASRTPEPQAPDDEEMVCIKLLSHLKRHSAENQQTLESMQALVQKSLASVRRIIRSRNVRSDYACQLLLSNIMMRIVELCENTCRRQMENNSSRWRNQQAPCEVISDHMEASNDSQSSPTEPASSTGATLQDAIGLVTSVGDLLKRKPYTGFQTMGRHESLHLALEQRLRSAVLNLEQ